jgi:hypothetical protein
MLILMFWLIAAGILLVINRKPLPPTEMAPAPAPI